MCLRACGAPIGKNCSVAVRVVMHVVGPLKGCTHLGFNRAPQVMLLRLARERRRLRELGATPPWPGQPPRCRCKCSHLTFCASATHPQTVRRKWASLLRRVLGFARRHLARHLQAVWLIFATGDACQGRPTRPSCSVNPCLGHTFCTWQYLPCRTVRPDPIGGSKQARGHVIGIDRCGPRGGIGVLFSGFREVGHQFGI